MIDKTSQNLETNDNNLKTIDIKVSLLKKIIFIFLGSLFLSVGIIGIILPMLPTTPFLLLTAFFYINSSEKLYSKFVRSRIYQKYVATFKRNKGLTLKAKLSILIPVWGMLLIMFFVTDILVIKILAISLGIIKTIVFIKMKTIKNQQQQLDVTVFNHVLRAKN